MAVCEFVYLALYVENIVCVFKMVVTKMTWIERRGEMVGVCVVSPLPGVEYLALLL